MIQILTPTMGNSFFCPPKRPDWPWGPLRFLFSGCWGVLPMGVKRHEVDQLLSPSAKVKMSAAVPLPLYIFMAKTWATLLLLFFRLVICVK